MMNGTGRPISQPRTNTRLRPHVSEMRAAKRLQSALTTPKLTMNDTMAVSEVSPNSCSPMSGTTVRSSPTMAPTKALIRTRRENCPRFSRRPSLISFAVTARTPLDLEPTPQPPLFKQHLAPMPCPAGFPKRNHRLWLSVEVAPAIRGHPVADLKDSVATSVERRFRPPGSLMAVTSPNAYTLSCRVSRVFPFTGIQPVASVSPASTTTAGLLWGGTPHSGQQF